MQEHVLSFARMCVQEHCVDQHLTCFAASRTNTHQQYLIGTMARSSGQEDPLLEAGEAYEGLLQRRPRVGRLLGEVSVLLFHSTQGRAMTYAIHL